MIMIFNISAAILSLYILFAHIFVYIRYSKIIPLVHFIFFFHNYCLFVFLPSSPPPPMPVTIQVSALAASWSWSRVFASLVCRGMRLQVSPGSAPASPDHGHPSCLGGCQPSSPEFIKTFWKWCKIHLLRLSPRTLRSSDWQEYFGPEKSQREFISPGRWVIVSQWCN